jgi:hypothetical protein
MVRRRFRGKPRLPVADYASEAATLERPSGPDAVRRSYFGERVRWIEQQFQ